MTDHARRPAARAPRPRDSSADVPTIASSPHGGTTTQPVGALRQDTLAVVLAGGRGTRLGALTRRHSKPALPFGGQSRTIDFALSNCVNSGLRRIGVPTQYMAHSLIQHVRAGWSHLRPELGEFVELWPAQQRHGTHWYRGTSDAIYQNLDLIRTHAPAYVLVLGGDHVYKMNYADLIDTHERRGASVTIGCVEVPQSQASGFGVVETDDDAWIRAFVEKPTAPVALREGADSVLASMGIYVFDTDFLCECLEADARDATSPHDFGHSIVPAIVGGRSAVLAYTFRDPATGRPGYWRDVGTLDSYWRTHMELLDEPPPLDLDDPGWPIRACPPHMPPARFAGRGVATRSIVSAGSVVSGAVSRSVLSPGCRIGADTTLEDAVVLPNARIGANCRIRRAVIDEGAVVPDGTVLDADGLAAAGAQISAEGIVLYTWAPATPGPRPRRASSRVA